ncbi:HAMP domain-containing histidine kinase [Leptolyngbya sp. 15MV]|nr:HAMP domain-containing histidine kinase [Leptolyngbya sp. 15MV]
MSHELRTPLNAIIGFSDMMVPGSRYALTSGQQADYARQINESGRVLLELINEILDYSSLARQPPQLALAWCQMDVLVGSALREIAALAIKGEIRLEAIHAVEGLQVRVDPLRFRQVLNNLLSNAVKFTAAGGCVTVATRLCPDGCAELVVRDTGVGMKPEDIPRAMEPFQQIDGGHARNFPGTGLGLPIAKGLVEAHGGTLCVTSAPGEGTAVTIRLRSDQTRNAAEAQPSAAD